jgi:hypothetical protein
MPSWRFFDAVTASPRIEYALLSGESEGEGDWQEFRPCPAQLRWPAMHARLFWNPQATEKLYLVSLAERLAQGENSQTIAHSQRQLLSRITRGLRLSGQGGMAQVRIRFIDSADPLGQITYQSAPFALQDMA